MSAITTHVLDTSLGKPAEGLTISLEVQSGDAWAPIGRGVTNADGRVPNLMQAGALEVARYRITFATGDYLAATDRQGFYPSVTVVFDITDAAQHYHVPLLLSPYGFSTYRGS